MKWGKILNSDTSRRNLEVFTWTIPLIRGTLQEQMDEISHSYIKFIVEKIQV
jgi:hypothetical protein